jgi:hypothetical protein
MGHGWGVIRKVIAWVGWGFVAWVGGGQGASNTRCGRPAADW